MALTLSRRKGQAILIGTDTLITIVRATSGGVVRISIDAPKSVSIARTEILPEFCRAHWEGRAAAAVSGEKGRAAK